MKLSTFSIYLYKNVGGCFVSKYVCRSVINHYPTVWRCRFKRGYTTIRGCAFLGFGGFGRVGGRNVFGGPDGRGKGFTPLLFFWYRRVQQQKGEELESENEEGTHTLDGWDFEYLKV